MTPGQDALNRSEVLHTQWRKVYRTGRRVRRSVSRRFGPKDAGVEYDRQTVQIMRRVLVKDSNAIDIGAAWGEMLRPMVKYASFGHHRAFEPLPQFAGKLREDFPNVEVHEVALGDHDGDAEFFFAVDAPGYSGLRHPAHPSETEIFTVQVRKLDNLIDLNEPIALMKIDVEGSELNVLRGGRECLVRHRPVVVFEYWNEIPEFGIRTWDIYDFLTRLGYGVSTLDQWLRSSDAPLDRSEFPVRRQDTGWHGMYVAYDVNR